MKKYGFIITMIAISANCFAIDSVTCKLSGDGIINELPKFASKADAKVGQGYDFKFVRAAKTNDGQDLYKMISDDQEASFYELTIKANKLEFTAPTYFESHRARTVILNSGKAYSYQVRYVEGAYSVGASAQLQEYICEIK